MRVALLCGKWNYGDINRGVGYEYSNFTPALRALGHDVHLVDTRDVTLRTNPHDLNRHVAQEVERLRPDVVFVVLTHYELWAELLTAIRAIRDVVTVNWCTDDSWRYKSFSRHIAPLFDIVVTTSVAAVKKYRRDGNANVMLSQWAVPSEVTRRPTPARDCRYPVTFVGSAHGSRDRVIRRLRGLGAPVHTFGFGWPAGAVRATDISEIVNSSVISLNFSNSVLQYDHVIPRAHRQLKARPFEVTGSGGFLLTEWAPDLDRYFRLGVDVVPFSSVDEAASKIRYYLAESAVRDAIALSGWRRTVAQHTYERRFIELLSRVQQVRHEKTVGAWCVDFRSGYLTSVVDSAATAYQRHERAIRFGRRLVLRPCEWIFGRPRGVRAARRLVFEISWRLCGKRTYGAAGVPGRLFPEAG